MMPQPRQRHIGTGRRSMSSIYAIYRVRPTIGYCVQILKGDVVLTEYTAGNARYDSAVFSRFGVGRKLLHKWARQTAQEMLSEHGGTGGVHYDKEIPFGQAD